MKKLLITLVAAMALIGAVYGAAASMSVPWSTLGAGSNVAGNAGDVTGITWILDGYTVSTDPAVLQGAPGNISLVDGVNLEFEASAVGVQAFVQALNSVGGVLASGTCEVTATGGLGWDEFDPLDNPAGCTADLDSGDISAEDIESYRVTTT